MLIGNFENSIDPKGRTRIPFKFKSELSGESAFFESAPGVVSIYTEGGLGKLFDVMKSADMFDEEAMLNFNDKMSRLSEYPDEDSQGRVLIPQSLRNHLRNIPTFDDKGNMVYTEKGELVCEPIEQLTKLVFTGVVDHVDIMSIEYFERRKSVKTKIFVKK